MALAVHYQSQVDDFFGYLAQLGDVYPMSAFSYAAVKRANQFILVHGRLHLSAFPIKAPPTHFQTENIRVGNYPLVELKHDTHELFDALLAGKVPTPGGDLFFPPEDNGQHNIYYNPFHQEGLQNQNRLSVLGLVGMRNLNFIRYVHNDWEIRAASTPYDGLQELLYIYQLGQFQSDGLRVEFVANPIVEVDLSGKVEGTKARPAVLLSKSADPNKVQLGYTVSEKGQVTLRGSLAGEKLDWSESPIAKRGSAEIEVPRASHFRSIASYNGLAQHLGWIVDTETVQNARRAAYETIDPKLAILEGMIKNSQEKVRRARDLELVVSWLLWMLGFNPAHFGHLADTQDAADVFAATPTGHMVVVECTTGLPKADKLSLLYERTQAVRAQLQASGLLGLRVIAAMVATKKKSDIGRNTFEDAAKQGVLLYTLEDLEKALFQTTFTPNADQRFTEAEQAIESKFSAVNAQGDLAL